MSPYFKNIVILIIAIVLQKSFIWLISISQYNIIPDLPLIVIIFIGIKNGRLESTISGFFAGLIIDVLSGTFVGLSALVYSLIGFIAGYFHSENEKYLKKLNFPVLVLILVLSGNILYFFIYFQSYSLLFLEVLLKYVIPNSTYTAIISLIYLALPRKKQSSLVY